MADLEQKFQKRQTAFKLSIKDILSAKYVKSEGLIPNYLDFSSKEVSRVNVIGAVIEKLDSGNYKTIAIEDGTGKISARIFDANISLERIMVGDVVLVIGRPREFSEEKYILIEAIKKIEPKWAKVRMMENMLREPNNKSLDASSYNEPTPRINSEQIAPSSSIKIVKLIRELDKGNGVSIDDLSSAGINELDECIKKLLKGGDIFEITHGKLKVLE